MMGSSNQIKKQSPKVICFGEALVDRLGPLGGDPSIDKPVKDCLGGAPANVACALARLGIDVAFIGRLGEDKIGNTFRNLMTQRGVNITGLQIDQFLPSRVVLVRRDKTGERFFCGFDGDKGAGFADEAIDLNELANQWESISVEALWLLIGTIPLASQSSSESLWWTVNHALEAGLRIAIDVNWRPTFWDSKAPADRPPNQTEQDLVKSLLEIAALLKLSKEEAIWFFNTDDPLSISRLLPNQPDVVVTDGALPVKWILNNSVGTMEVPRGLSIIDTTGAGDAFAAGLIFQLLQDSKSFNNQSFAKEIVSFASACGALVCSGAGAIDPQPTYDQVNFFLSSQSGGNR